MVSRPEKTARTYEEIYKALPPLPDGLGAEVVNISTCGCGKEHLYLVIRHKFEVSAVGYILLMAQWVSKAAKAAPEITGHRTEGSTVLPTCMQP